MAEPVVIFFDLGDTLATPTFSPDGSLQGFRVFPLAKDVLKRLRGVASAGTGTHERRLGIISNTGAESPEKLRSLLQTAGLLKHFDPGLLLFSSAEGLDKSQRAFFELAAQRSGVPPSRCVFVGESDAERKVATSAHFVVSFHPLHVFHVVDQLEA